MNAAVITGCVKNCRMILHAEIRGRGERTAAGGLPRSGSALAYLHSDISGMVCLCVAGCVWGSLGFNPAFSSAIDWIG